MKEKLCNDSLVLVPFSKMWRKEKIAEIYKNGNGIPAFFYDMSKIKESNYFAKTNLKICDKPLSFNSLKNIPGIYMINNRRTKKFYIGMSRDLKSRLYNYLDIHRLNNNKSSMINRKLLKHGFENFSISILELPPLLKIERSFIISSYLRIRKDFFIGIFRPQYNIRRSSFNRLSRKIKF